MYTTFSWWRGEKPSSFGDYGIGFFTGRGERARAASVRRSDSTTCREVLGRQVRRASDDFKMFFRKDFLEAAEIKNEAQIKVLKGNPGVEWMTIWKNLYVKPSVFGEVIAKPDELLITLKNEFLSLPVAGESEISFPLFFYNRQEEFPLTTLLSYDLTIKKIISYGEAFWGSSGGGRGYLTFCHAFAVYALKRGVQLPYDLGPTTSGVGCYILENVLYRYLPMLDQFCKEYSLNIEDLIRDSDSAYTGQPYGMLSIVAQLAQYRSKAPKSSTKSDQW
jgi:hypothetical protein